MDLSTKGRLRPVCYSAKMKKMKLRLIFTFFMITLTACGTTQAAPAAVPTVSRASEPASQPAPAQAANSTPESIPPTAVPVESLPETNTPLTLSVLQPPDETVVDTPEIDVIGTAPPDTVITVNDEILLVGPEQRFEVTILLEEGPNLIEIVASDTNGNETSQLLTIFYEP